MEGEEWSMEGWRVGGGWGREIGGLVGGRG